MFNCLIRLLRVGHLAQVFCFDTAPLRMAAQTAADKQANAANAAKAAKLFEAEYSPELYDALKDDTVRVEGYRRAIAARVQGLSL